MNDNKKTDNEIIAEFMGWKNLGRTESGLNMWRTDKAPIGTTLIADTLGEQFNTSWDWLMPVVEKINATTFDNERVDVIIYRNSCHINDPRQIVIEATGQDMLDCTYKAVIEFIRLYNSTKAK